MPTTPIFLLPILLLSLLVPRATRADLPGTWELLLTNAGISSMHTAVTRHGTVVLLDRTDIGPTRKTLPRNNCRYDPHDKALRLDCYAHSVLFDPSTNRILRPLKILTDTWCSSGQFLPDGSLLQTGGDLDGSRKFRLFPSCPPHQLCDWLELKTPQLATGRWYATDQILPDGSVIIVGGRAANSVEFYPPSTVRTLPFLADMEDTQMDNLYPYVHLLPDGNLFIFANTKSVLYDYRDNRILRYFPQLEGGPRNYPSAGSSVMLPLDSERGDFRTAEVVICGGARYGAFIERSTDAPAGGSCGRIVVAGGAEDPAWAMEDMPYGRIMGDMVLLPSGHVLVINGAQAGTQGFEMASAPCLNPILYRPDEPSGLRFMPLTPSAVPRMYHSTANLLPDGRILIAGSNPHYFYRFDAEFPTELRLEAFSPEYLSPDRANLRPSIVGIPETIRYGEGFAVTVTVPLPVVEKIEVNFASAPFVTHSFSQGQRLVKLGVSPAMQVSGGAAGAGGTYRIGCTAPPDGRVAPPGYYMVFAVNQGVPSVARWAQLVL